MILQDPNEDIAQDPKVGYYMILQDPKGDIAQNSKEDPESS